VKSIVLVGAATILAIGAGVTAKLQLASEDLPAQPPGAVAPAEAGSPDDDATTRTGAEESTEDGTFDPADDSMTDMPTDDPTIPGYDDEDRDDEDDDGPGTTHDEDEEDEEHEGDEEHEEDD
jgi:hypothetical protein